MNIVPQDFVLVAGDQLVTDSRLVAKHFGRRHRNVLQAIRNVDCSTQFRALNFQQCFEINALANGKPEPVVRMTKDGFMFLVMGFTGAKAAAIKEAFIAAFNRMAEFIHAQAMATLRQYNDAMQQHLSDKREASRHGRGLREWQDVKPQQLEYLARLHPQIPLFPAFT